MYGVMKMRLRKLQKTQELKIMDLIYALIVIRLNLFFTTINAKDSTNANIYE